MENQDELWEKHVEGLIACRKCPRLVAWREEVARVKRRAYRDQTYWGKPVPGFGDLQARVALVGLAPGAHGSNRTGRMFTGDKSGDFLYASLYRAGFANQSTCVDQSDGLVLTDMFITAACRCAPPDNKVNRDEVINCRPYLLAELGMLPRLQGIVALGGVGFDAVVALYQSLGQEISGIRFRHGAFYELGGKLPWLMATYHPSPQNTSTKRLTPAMMDEIWVNVRQRIV
jgi:uracil-DNA glycosylase family 4